MLSQHVQGVGGELSVAGREAAARLSHVVGLVSSDPAEARRQAELGIAQHLAKARLCSAVMAAAGASLT